MQSESAAEDGNEDDRGLDEEASGSWSVYFVGLFCGTIAFSVAVIGFLAFMYGDRLEQSWEVQG